MKYFFLFFSLIQFSLLASSYSIQDMINGTNGADPIPSSILAGSTTWNFSGLKSLSSIEGIQNLSGVAGVAPSSTVVTIDLGNTGITAIPPLTAKVPHVPIINILSIFTSLTKLILGNNYNIYTLDLRANSGAGVPSSLNYLDIGYTSLSFIPDLSQLINLRTLILSGIQGLRTISFATVSTGLTALYLNNMSLSSIPQLGRFRRLEVLDLGNNTLGGNINLGSNDSFPLLKELYLASTGIQSLSTVKILYSSLIPNLEVLDLSTDINHLDLSNNYFISLDFDVRGVFTHLKKLYINYCNLQFMPNFSAFPNLEELYLNNNRIGYANGRMNFFTSGASSNLRKIHIRSNGISEFPDLYQFPVLEVVDAGGNLFGYRSGTIDLQAKGTPITLKELRLDNSFLTGIPYVGFLSSLEIFDVNSNLITLLPRSSTFFPQTLKELYLQRNMIDFRINPVSFAPFSLLSQLLVLDLTNNALTNLPSGLFQAPLGISPTMGPGNSLRSIYLSGNNGLTLSSGFSFPSGMFNQLQSGATIYVDFGTSLGTAKGRQIAGVPSGVTVKEVG